MSSKRATPTPAGHSLRVMQYAMGIARALGWTSDQLQVLEMGARLHDIGKIGIPDSILQKPAPLDKAEYLEMQTHVVIGIRILEGIQSLAIALPYVAYHHEHFNGQGYPFGLSGSAIPEEGRLLAVADAFDAITSARPYRPPAPPKTACARSWRTAAPSSTPVMVDAMLLAHETGVALCRPERTSTDRGGRRASPPAPTGEPTGQATGRTRHLPDEYDISTPHRSRT